MRSSLLAVVLALLAARPANAGEFDATEFIRRKEYEVGQRVEAVRQSIVVVGGMFYRRLEVGASGLLVPKRDDLSAVEIQRGICVGSAVASEMSPAAETGPLVTASELRIADEVRLHTALILETIAANCGFIPVAEP